MQLRFNNYFGLGMTLSSERYVVVVVVVVVFVSLLGRERCRVNVPVLYV